jgi:integrase
MATVKLYLDTRSANRQGLHTLKLAINHASKTSYISLNVQLASSQWDKNKACIIAHPRKQSLNSYISAMLLNAQDTMLRVARERGIKTLSAIELRDIISESINGTSADDASRGNIVEMLERMANDPTKSNSTHKLYTSLQKHLVDFDSDFENKNFDDINREYINSFYGYLMNNKHINTAACYMGKFAAAFNRAIDDEITSNYPFRRIKLKHQQTRKRALRLDQLRTLINARFENRHHDSARDYFLLMFYLIGINNKDLCLLKGVTDDGYIEYRRSKTSRLFRIKVHPVTLALIEKHKDTSGKYLLELMAKYKSPTNVRMRINAHLTNLCEELGLPKITAYWSRHTWATIAASLDINKDTISRALGHSFGVRVTDTYIDYDDNKISEANEKVINFVLGKIENRN